VLCSEVAVAAVGERGSKVGEKPPHAPTIASMADIRSFFSKSAASASTLEVSDEEEERPVVAPVAPVAPVDKRPAPDAVEKPKAKVAKAKPGPKPKEEPVLKTLVVKSEGEAPGYVSKPEYQKYSKYVVATHRNIKVRTEDTVTYTVKQRGQIDSEIGGQEETLGCDELLAVGSAAQMIAELLTESREKRLVVIAYKKKGMHAAYLLGKLAWGLVCRKNKALSDVAKVGEPGNWVYSNLWKEVKTVKPDKLQDALEEWYRAN
jgi:hypothetical protein